MTFPVEFLGIVTSAVTAVAGATASSELAAKLSARILEHFGFQLKLARSNGHTTATTATTATLPAEAPDLPSNLTHPKFRKAEQHLIRRIIEARAQQRKNQYNAAIFRWSARLLTFSQYIIGLVLATSFVKQQFSPQIIGAAGVIVVVASGINQRFSPGVGAEIAAQKAQRLEALIRETEDAMIEIETTISFEDDDPKRVLALLKRFSAELTKIKASSPSRARLVSSTQRHKAATAKDQTTAP